MALRFVYDKSTDVSHTDCKPITQTNRTMRVQKLNCAYTGHERLRPLVKRVIFTIGPQRDVDNIKVFLLVRPHMAGSELWNLCKYANLYFQYDSARTCLQNTLVT